MTVRQQSDDPSELTPHEARARFRAGLRVPTAGWAAGCESARLTVNTASAATSSQIQRFGPPALRLTRRRTSMIQPSN